jgi:CDP-glucose 4,6-dehydratase
LLATARAGNVIGGGDWSEDRLIPDLVRAVTRGESLEIRSPRATRPWQHVLESLSGYLLLGQRLLEGQPDFAEAWNFGPDDAGNQPVEWVLNNLRQAWPDMRWHVGTAPQPHEAGLLHVVSTKARHRLGWLPVWNLEQSLSQTADWYRRHLESQDLASVEQLGLYIETARQNSLGWAG